MNFIAWNLSTTAVVLRIFVESCSTTQLQYNPLFLPQFPLSAPPHTTEVNNVLGVCLCVPSSKASPSRTILLDSSPASLSPSMAAGYRWLKVLAATTNASSNGTFRIALWARKWQLENGDHRWTRVMMKTEGRAWTGVQTERCGYDNGWTVCYWNLFDSGREMSASFKPSFDTTVRNFLTLTDIQLSFHEPFVLLKNRPPKLHLFLGP